MDTVVETGEFQGTDRFRPRRRLGAGAFGAVYEADDLVRGGTVALKALHERDPEALLRFKREFRSLADLAHPNLVVLYELFSEEAGSFFTMELVRGESLLDHVRGGGAGGVPGRLRAALLQLADGLRALHAAGKLHRDVKPSNVLVTSEGQVKLLDFGLVAELGGRQGHEAAGTPAYMSPEQAAGRAATEASDWYAVGAVMYEALTGRLPFPGEPLEVMVTKQWFEPAPPRELEPSVPEELDALCRELLHREPEARPVGREVRRRLEGTDPRESSETGRRGRCTPFVGRRPLLKALESAFERSRSGRTVTAFVTGRSGMGKSALVKRFLDEIGATEPRAIVLAGRCYQQESVPYKAVDGLIDALAATLRELPREEADPLLPPDVRALARLFPVLGELKAVAGARRRVLAIPDAQELRRRAFAALRELFARLARRGPLVLFIDDLQWGDADSALLLGDVLRPPGSPPLLVVAAYRSEDRESNALLLALRASLMTAETEEVTVEALSETEAADLVTLLAGESPARSRSFLESVASEAEGSPYLIQELVRHAAPAAGVEGPCGVDGMIRERVARLPEEARALLQVVAVAGRPLAAHIARDAARLHDAPAAAALLRAGHLLLGRSRAGVEELETVHDRIREAIVSGLSRAERKILHGRLARAMEASGDPDPERLSVHLEEAEEPLAAGVQAGRAAERAASTLAFDRAARLCRKALELGAPEGNERRALLVRLGLALANAGRGPESGRAYLEAAGRGPDDEAVELRRRAAEQLLRSGHIDEGLEAIRTVLREVGEHLAATPFRALASLVVRRARVSLRGLRFEERSAAVLGTRVLIRIDTCWSVAVGLGIVDPVRGAAFNARHLLLALEAGEPYRVARALALEAGYSASEGMKSRQRTARLLETAASVAERVEEPHARGLVQMVEGIAAALEGRFREASVALDSAERVLREQCTGVAWELFNTQYFSLLSRFYLGEFGRIAQRIPVLLKEAEERGDLFAATSLAARIAYFVPLAEDDVERARRDLRRAMERWSRVGFHVQHLWGLFGEAEIGLYAGEGGAVHRLWRAEEPRVARSLLTRIQLVRIGVLQRHARSALAAAREHPPGSAGRRALLYSARRDARKIDREGTYWGSPMAALVRAGAAAAAGSEEEAARELRAAVAGFDRVRMDGYAAASRRRLGALIGGEEGVAFVETSGAWMVREGIRNPARLAAMLAPGFRDEG